MIAFARMLDDEQSPHVEQVLLKTRVHGIGPAVRMFALHYLVILFGSKSKKLRTSVTVYQRKWKESQDVPCHFGIFWTNFVCSGLCDCPCHHTCEVFVPSVP